MKKSTSLLLLGLAVLLSVFLLSACENSGETARRQSESGTVTDILKAADDNTPKPSEPTSPEDGSEEKPSASLSSDYDVDLTVLSGTMVYAEVFNMMSSPESYIGKTVRMSGDFAIFHDEQTDKIYFACLISDATACCSQGIEFSLAEKRAYPDDFPELGSKITVTGAFRTYEEDGYTYCELADAEMIG